MCKKLSTLHAMLQKTENTLKPRFTKGFDDNKNNYNIQSSDRHLLHQSGAILFVFHKLLHLKALVPVRSSTLSVWETDQVSKIIHAPPADPSFSCSQTLT